MPRPLLDQHRHTFVVLLTEPGSMSAGFLGQDRTVQPSNSANGHHHLPQAVYRAKTHHDGSGTLPTLAYGPSLLLIMLQPDVSTALVYHCVRGHAVLLWVSQADRGCGLSYDTSLMWYLMNVSESSFLTTASGVLDPSYDP